MGIEGKKLLTPEDDFDALKEFNAAYEGSRTVVEDLHLEYQSLLQDFPDLESELRGFPGAVFSGREKLAEGVVGVFFCYSLPALDKETGEFTEEAGTTGWYFYDLSAESILEEPGEIAESIRSAPDTSRRLIMEESKLIDIRDQIEKYVKNTYLKQIDAPIGVSPRLRCWMEINKD